MTRWNSEMIRCCTLKKMTRWNKINITQTQTVRSDPAESRSGTIFCSSLAVYAVRSFWKCSESSKNIKKKNTNETMKFWNDTVSHHEKMTWWNEEEQTYRKLRLYAMTQLRFRHGTTFGFSLVIFIVFIEILQQSRQEK